MSDSHGERRRLATTAGMIGLLLCATNLPAHAQIAAASDRSAAGTITATRAISPPRLDGRDDDAVWRVAERRINFRTFLPSEDGEPVARTELRVAYDDRALYVFVRAFDSRPDSIARLLSRRDTDGPPNDQVQLFVDSYHDRRSGYEFIVNAAGVKSDYLLFDDSGFDQSWDGVWDAATRVDSLGWTAEIAIPLQQLRFSDRESPTFGIMVWRLVGRTGERVSWPLFRPSRSGLVSQAGTLRGMSALARPASIQAIPYALARARNALPGTNAASSLGTGWSLGSDVRLIPRPSVSVDATINPDFGQLEADPAVLDLTGVEVFQVERRPFFLEGAGQLNLPLTSDGSALFFYSRRIGRMPALAYLADGDAPTETTILGAAKLTARVSPTTSLALLSATTSREEITLRSANGPSARRVVEPLAHYGVARVQRDFRGGRSGVGFMITRVDRETGDSGVVASMPTLAQAAAMTMQHQSRDGNYRMTGWLAASELRGSAAAIAIVQRSNIHGFQQPDGAARLDSTRVALGGGAGQLFAGKVAGGTTRYDASYRWIAPGFDVNEMGYLTQSGVQSVSVRGGLKSTRAGVALGIPYRSASLTLGVTGDWTTSALPLARGASLTGSIQWANQAQLQGTLAQQFGGAYCTMRCTRGGPALLDPPRSSASLDITGDPRRRLIPHANIEWYRDDEGRSHGTGGQLDVLWRARTNIEVSLIAYTLESRLDAFFYGRFGVSDTAHLTFARLDQPVRSLTSRIDYTVAPTLSVQWYAQVYLSRGAYSDVRELVDPRAANYDSRFHSYGDSTVAAHPGGLDFRQLRSNAVVRWEYRPGSTIFVVWTQARSLDAANVGPLRVGPDFRGLLALRPRNIVAVKVAYWFDR